MGKRCTVAIVGALVAISGTGRAEPDSKQESGGVGVGLGMFLSRPDVRSATFHGEGTPLGGGPHQSFEHSGRAIGVTYPMLAGVELRFGYVGPTVILGATLFAGGQVGQHHGPAGDAVAASFIDPNDVSVMGAGGHFAVVVARSKPFTLTLGPDFGVRSLLISLPGFQQTTCHSKTGTYACDETASATQLYLQPRVTFTFTTGALTRKNSGLFVSAWIGSELLPTPTVAGGLTFGLISDRLR